MKMENRKDFAWFAGINSSRLIATGDIVNAYVKMLVKKNHLSSSAV
jgi:hypothetical protein